MKTGICSTTPVVAVSGISCGGARSGTILGFGEKKARGRTGLLLGALNLRIEVLRIPQLQWISEVCYWAFLLTPHQRY